MKRLYLYGVLAARGRVDGARLGGDDVGPVRVVRHNGVDAVVSEYSGRDLQSLSREVVLRRLLAHQRVVERAMAGSTVLPVKFGTVLSGYQDLYDLLDQANGEIVAAIDAICGKAEIEMAAIWDTERMIREVAQEEEVVVAREEIVRQRSPTLNDRVYLGRIVKECIDKRRDSYRERMLAHFELIALDVVSNVLVSDRMVMNVAILIERAREREFDERVQLLDTMFQHVIDFRVIGPLPPYSFSTMEVSHLDGAQLGAARQMLSLGPSFSETDVRQAYRRLAAQTQLTSTPGGDHTRNRIAELREACDLLLRYRKSLGPADPPEIADEGRWTVTIRRTSGDAVDPIRFSAER